MNADYHSLLDTLDQPHLTNPQREGLLAVLEQIDARGQLTAVDHIRFRQVRERVLKLLARKSA
jgi:hypothetical protein